jgi:hypothetical protein
MQQINRSFEDSYKVKAYFVFGFAMYIFFKRLISASMLSQIGSPPFLFDDHEFIYNLFIASHIPQFITSHLLLAALFDISLLIFALAFLLSSRRIYAMLFFVLVLNYFLTYNVITGHHFHGLIGLMVMVVPFWFKKEEKFLLAWEGARYYLFYIFASAALWKIVRGSVFYGEQLSNILKPQHLNLFLQNGNNYKAWFAAYLISHSSFSHLVLIANVALQLFFAAGFFTKRLDYLLFWLFVIFCIANYFVMGIYSVELLILGFTLLNWQKIEAYVSRLQL